MAIDVLQFNPANWIQASDTNTLYDAETGGSLVAAGGAVARLEDKSGNGRHWTQATASYRPTRQVAVQNGKDVIRLDGLDDTLTRAGFMTGATAGTLFFVMKLVADPPTGDGGIGLAAPFSLWGTDTTYEHMPWTDGSIYFSWGSTSRKTVGNPSLSMASWRIYSVTSAANSWIFRIDGVTVYTSTSNTVAWGATPHIGGAYTNWCPQCDIAEAIAVPSLLSDTQRQKAEGYLAWEWGLQGNLDASHPYKNEPPTDAASSGAGSVALGTLTQTATGVLELKASCAKTFGAMTAASVGTLAISGLTDKTLGSLTQISTGKLAIQANASQSLFILSATAGGAVVITGTDSATLGSLTQISTGQVGIVGNASQTLGALTQTAGGFAAIQASVNQTLGELSQNAIGVLAIQASANQNFGELISVSSSASDIKASVTGILGSIESVSDSTLAIVGAASLQFGGLQSRGYGGGLVIFGTNRGRCERSTNRIADKLSMRPMSLSDTRQSTRQGARQNIQNKAR